MKSDNLEFWLTRQLTERNLSARELGRRVGVAHTTINRIVNGDLIPSAKVCIKLADGLNIRREEVLRLAGYLPPEPEIFEGRNEALSLLARLDGSIRQSIIATMRSLLGLRSVGVVADERGPAYDVNRSYTTAERMAQWLEREMAQLTADERDELVQRMLRVRDQLNRGQVGRDVETVT